MYHPILAELRDQQITDSNATMGTSTHIAIDIMESTDFVDEHGDIHQRDFTSGEVGSPVHVRTIDGSIIGRDENPDNTGSSTTGEEKYEETARKVVVVKISVMVRE